MATYKSYPTYKDSKIQWLGEIPEHWEIIRIKFLFKEINERSNDGIEDLLSVSQYTGVTKKKDKVAEGELLTNASSLEGYKKVKVGDLVSNIMLAWNGSLGVSPYNGITSPAYGVYRLTNGCDPNFFNYLFRTDLYKAEFKRNSTGVIESRLRLYSDDFFNICSILPPVAEQTAIANFLDLAISEIAGFIALKEKTISLLKERKTAIINKAVTKGLDETVPMKDSGIEWLGEIPAHWEVKYLRYLGKCQNGVSNGADYFGSGFPFVGYGDAYKNRILPDEVSGLAKATKRDRELYAVKQGDIFFTRTSETIEEIGFASTCLKTIKDASFSGFLIRFRPMKNCLDPSFSKYYFRSNLHRPYFTKKMNLVIRASLSQDLLKGLPVASPALSEQKIIGDYLDQKVAIFDQSILQAEKEISLIKEYQQNLISEAVTGKIDVRDVLKREIQIKLAAEVEVA